MSDPQTDIHIVATSKNGIQYERGQDDAASILETLREILAKSGEVSVRFTHQQLNHFRGECLDELKRADAERRATRDRLERVIEGVARLKGELSARLDLVEAKLGKTTTDEKAP